MLRSLVVHRVARLELSSQVDPWSKMPLKALKVECKNKGLKVSGKKVELIKRLREARTISGSKNGSRTSDEQESVVIPKPVEQKIASRKRTRISTEKRKVVVPRPVSPLASNDQTVHSRRIEPKRATELKDKPIVNSPTRSIGFHHPKQKVVQSRSLNQIAGLEHSAKKEGILKETVSQVQREKLTQLRTKDDPKRLILQINNNEPTTHPKYTALQRQGSPADSSDVLQDRLTAQLCFRDKFFLFTSITSITIWWWLPYVPSIYLKVLTSYKYLQSFF